MPYTVADVARLVNVSPTTIRNWSREYDTFLSASAAPPAGEDRLYQEEDIAVMATIAAMRQERQSFEAIRAALADGERIQPPAEDQPEEEQPGQQSALVTRLTATVARFEGELQATKEERDYLRVKLEEERQARQEATERAIRAEMQLSIQSSPTIPESAPDTPPERPATLRQRLARWFGGQS